MKNTTNSPKIGNVLLQLIVVGNSIPLKWVKTEDKSDKPLGSAVAQW